MHKCPAVDTVKKAIGDAADIAFLAR